MKKIFTSLLLLLGLCATAQVKIGDNPTTVGASSLLELESTNKALVVPRVANTAAITNPVNGMIVYDISSQCFKGYQNGEWSGCGMTQSATASILAQIGAEADSPDIVPSQVSATQLYSLGVTSVVPAYEGAYQEYIDANPGLFSNPATMAEVQAMIMAVNSQVTDILTQIGNEGDNPNTIVSVVTIDQLQDLGITGVTPGNEIAYQEYIDSHPDAFGNPASIAEIQSLVTTVNNTVTSVLAQIGTEGDNPDTVNSVVTATQLQSIGITGVTPANEVAYQDYIDANPNAFSSPATTSEVQAMVTAVNASANTSGGTGTVSAYVCNTASAGTLTAGTAASGVTQTITATVTTVGTYSISATANGITFSGSGTFAGTGSQAIVLTASGTPTAAGSNSFTLNTTPGCSFTRSTIDSTSGGDAAVSSWDCTGTLTGVVAVGVPVSGLTKVVTANVSTAGSYSISATANGITFSGSGTFAGTGSQAITLTATGTPTAAGTHSFTLSSTPSCSFDVTTKTLSTVDYVTVRRQNSSQTLTANTDLIFDVNKGGNIPYNTATGVFTLTAGKTYRLSFNGYLFSFNASSAFAVVNWVDATSNSPLLANTEATFQPQNEAGNHDHKPTSDIIYTPVSNQTVKLRLTMMGGATLTYLGASGAMIQELGTVAVGNTFSTVDYVMARQSVTQSVSSSNTDLKVDVIEGGNIPYNTSTGVFTLTAGKTYHLLFEGRMINYSSTNNGQAVFFWADASSGSALSNLYGFSVATNHATLASTSTTSTELTYTPATNQTIKLIARTNSGTADLMSGTVHIYQLGNNSTLGTVAYNTSFNNGGISIPTVNSAVDLKMDSDFNGTITHNTTTGGYTLQAGKTYRLTFVGEFSNFSSTSGYMYTQWTDLTTNSELQASTGGYFLPVSYSPGNDSRNGNMTIIYTPSSTQTVIPKAYLQNAGTAALSSGWADRVVIEELGVKAN